MNIRWEDPIAPAATAMENIFASVADADREDMVWKCLELASNIWLCKKGAAPSHYDSKAFKALAITKALHMRNDYMRCRSCTLHRVCGELVQVACEMPGDEAIAQATESLTARTSRRAPMAWERMEHADGERIVAALLAALPCEQRFIAQYLYDHCYEHPTLVEVAQAMSESGFRGWYAKRVGRTIQKLRNAISKTFLREVVRGEW